MLLILGEIRPTKCHTQSSIDTHPTQFLFIFIVFFLFAFIRGKREDIQ